MNKVIFVIACCLFVIQLYAQPKAENLIIITTDGLRWQEVFKGVDTALANNRQFNENGSKYIMEMYGDQSGPDSRKRLFPFLWSEISRQGQLYGNRLLGAKVNNANPYWFSYPGYSEFLTGFVDEKVNSNGYPDNPHTSVLAFLQQQQSFKGKVAAFGAWEAFNRILNEKKSGFPVVAAFDETGGKSPSPAETLINRMLKDSYKPWNEDECLDVFTHYAAMEHLRLRHPRVLYIAYGETDEWAHSGKYKSYLNAAHQVDQWIKEIWSFVQNDPAYKNKTALLLTVDHGRGEGENWTSHGSRIPGADQTWFALLGPGVPAKGEVKSDVQVFQKQLAQTVASMLGLKFTAEHPIENRVEEVWRK